MFLHVSVILLTGGEGGSPENPPPRDQGEPPPRDQGEPPPRDQGEPPTPRHQVDPPPRREEHCSIRSMSGRYASYWNAFLFNLRKPARCKRYSL